jgi:hypothetical protein
MMIMEQFQSCERIERAVVVVVVVREESSEGNYFCYHTAGARLCMRMDTVSHNNDVDIVVTISMI